MILKLNCFFFQLDNQIKNDLKKIKLEISNASVCNNRLKELNFQYKLNGSSSICSLGNSNQNLQFCNVSNSFFFSNEIVNIFYKIHKKKNFF